MPVSLKIQCQECKARGYAIASPDSTSPKGYSVDKVVVKHKRGCTRRPTPPKHFNNKKKWQRGEKRGNEIVGAKETMVSGALNKDGDGRIINEWRVETKTTSKDSYRLTKANWEKLAEGAIAVGEDPIFYVETSYASFVIYRDVLHYEDKVLKDTSPKSFLLSKKVALELNEERNRKGQILSGWLYTPCVTLRQHFTKEQINERSNN